MKTTATIEQLNQALNFVNKQFDNNIRFKDIEQISKNRVKFTLTVNDSNKPGAKFNPNFGKNGRRIAAACWHVHGYFFEYLFLTYDNILIISQGKKMSDNSDNWKDRNIGSTFQPLYFSEACKCY